MYISSITILWTMHNMYIFHVLIEVCAFSSFNTWACVRVQVTIIVGFRLVEMAILTSLKPAIYRNLYENNGSVLLIIHIHCCYIFLQY